MFHYVPEPDIGKSSFKGEHSIDSGFREELGQNGRRLLYEVNQSDRFSWNLSLRDLLVNRKRESPVG